MMAKSKKEISDSLQVTFIIEKMSCIIYGRQPSGFQIQWMFRHGCADFESIKNLNHLTDSQLLIRRIDISSSSLIKI